MSAVTCRLQRVIVDDILDSHAVVIVDIASTRTIHIPIGGLEAAAIQRGLREEHFPRPLTHDLMLSIIQGLGAVCTGIHITQHSDQTFYGELKLHTADDRPTHLDCRPSDALALLARWRDIPLTVAPELFADS